MKLSLQNPIPMFLDESWSTSPVPPAIRSFGSCCNQFQTRGFVILLLEKVQVDPAAEKSASWNQTLGRIHIPLCWNTEGAGCNSYPTRNARAFLDSHTRTRQCILVSENPGDARVGIEPNQPPHHLMSALIWCHCCRERIVWCSLKEAYIKKSSPRPTHVPNGSISLVRRTTLAKHVY